MSASVGTTQQPLGIGIGKFGSAVFAVALAAVVAASLMLGMPSLAKPATPVAGPATGIDHGSRTELGAPAIVPNANVNDHGSRGELGAPVLITLPKSFGGWNGPRSTTGGGIDDIDHGARDDAGTGAGTSGSNGPRLRAQ